LKGLAAQDRTLGNNIAMAEMNGAANTQEPVATQAQTTSKDSKQINGAPELSNAEKKKLAKAEKAAKRAADKAVTGAPAPAAEAGPSTQAKPEASQGQQSAKRRPSMIKRQGDVKLQDIKTQPKQVLSGPGKTDKQIPIRGRRGSQSVGSDAMQETKQVSFFAHLYGQPRRQILEGSAKDVHPAIQALGLQLSNYTICGSHARCIAMLLALKSVRAIWASIIDLLLTPLPGNTILHHSTRHFTPTTSLITSSLTSTRTP